MVPIARRSRNPHSRPLAFLPMPSSLFVGRCLPTSAQMRATLLTTSAYASLLGFVVQLEDAGPITAAMLLVISAVSISKHKSSHSHSTSSENPGLEGVDPTPCPVCPPNNATLPMPIPVVRAANGFPERVLAAVVAGMEGATSNGIMRREAGEVISSYPREMFCDSVRWSH